MNIEDIFQSIRVGDFDLFSKLIDQIEIDVLNEDRQSLLHEAAAFNNIDCTEELLKRGISAEIQDPRGQIALHYACANSAFEVGKLIINSGTNISVEDNFGNQPLWTAAFNARGRYELVKELMKFGANPEHKNTNGKSPLDFAKQIKDEELISILSA